MKDDSIKIYCKFNNTEKNVEEIICKIFKDYLRNKNIELKSRQNEKNTLK